MPLSFDDLIPAAPSAPAAQPAAATALSFDDLVPPSQQQYRGGVPIGGDAAIPLVATDGVRSDLARPGAPTSNGPVADALGLKRSVGEDLAIGMQDVGRGVAGAIGAPADLMAGLYNGGLRVADALNIIDDPNYSTGVGSHTIRDAASRLYESLGGHVYTDKERSYGENVIGKGVEYATSALLPGAALTKLAATEARGASPIVEALTDPYRANAARTIRGDTAAGLGSGMTVGAYEQLPDQVKNRIGALGPIAAALTGGLGGATVAAAGEGLLKAGTNVMRDVYGGNVERSLPPNDLTGKPFTRAEADQAAAEVQQAASNPATAGREIAEQAAALDQFASRGEQPTTGALSGDVGLILRENAQRTKDTRRFIERDRGVNDFARTLLDRSAPNGAEGRNLTDFADAEITRRLADADAGLADARERAGIHAGATQAEGDLADYRGRGKEASARLDDAFRTTLSDETRRKNALYNAPLLTRAPVDAAPLVEMAAGMRRSVGPVSDPTSLPADILGRIEGLAIRDENGAVTGYQPLTYGDVQDLRAQVSEAMDQALAASGRGASGSGPRVDRLREIRQALDATVDQLADGEGGAADAARDALGNYRDNFAPRFKQGRAGDFTRALRSDPTGTRTRPEDTAGKFLSGNKGADAESLGRAIDLPNNPDRANDARIFLMDQMASAGVRDPATGALRPDRIAEWRAKNEAVVARVPGMAGLLDQVTTRARGSAQVSADLAAEVRNAETRVGQARRDTRSGALGALGGKNPENAVASVFESSDPERTMQEVVRLTDQSPEARAGLKAAVRDYLVDKSTTSALQKTLDGRRPVSFAKLENFFDRNARALAEVYSPEEMQALRNSHDLLRPLGNLALRGTSGSDTAEKGQNLFRAVEAGLKAKYGVLKGGGIMRTLRIAIESLPNDRRNVDQLVQQFMFDPDLAVHLLGRDVSDRISTPQWNAKLNRLLAYGAGVREDDDQ